MGLSRNYFMKSCLFSLVIAYLPIPTRWCNLWTVSKMQSFGMRFMVTFIGLKYCRYAWLIPLDCCPNVPVVNWAGELNLLKMKLLLPQSNYRSIQDRLYSWSQVIPFSSVSFLCAESNSAHKKRSSSPLKLTEKRLFGFLGFLWRLVMSWFHVC